MHRDARLQIRPYLDADEQSWLRCRVLGASHDGPLAREIELHAAHRRVYLCRCLERDLGEDSRQRRTLVPPWLMTEPLNRVAALFDRVADTYDAVGVPWFSPIAAGLVRELAPMPGERALDVGCGRGAATIPLAEGVGAGGKVIGIDFAPRMVEATAADVAHLPQVEIRVADASSPGLPLASFDVVTSSLVLFFLPEPQDALRAWSALLVPGGRLGITTFGPSESPLAEVDRLFSPYLPSAVLDARTSGQQGPFSSDHGVEEMFTTAGLVDVRTAHLALRTVLTGPGQWRDFSWSHGQRGLWEAAGVEHHATLLADALALLEAAREPDGTVVLRQDVRCTLGVMPTPKNR